MVTIPPEIQSLVVCWRNENPAEYEKLRADHSIIPNMVSEIIRWQTPLAYMRRTALIDTELGVNKLRPATKW